MRGEKTKQFSLHKPWYVARWQGRHGMIQGICFFGRCCFPGRFVCLFLRCSLVRKISWLVHCCRLEIDANIILGRWIGWSWGYDLKHCAPGWKFSQLLCLAFYLSDIIGWCDIELRFASIILYHLISPGGLELPGEFFSRKRPPPGIPNAVP